MDELTYDHTSLPKTYATPSASYVEHPQVPIDLSYVEQHAYEQLDVFSVYQLFYVYFYVYLSYLYESYPIASMLQCDDLVDHHTTDSQDYSFFVCVS